MGLPKIWKELQVSLSKSKGVDSTIGEKETRFKFRNDDPIGCNKFVFITTKKKKREKKELMILT